MGETLVVGDAGLDVVVTPAGNVVVLVAPDNVVDVELVALDVETDGLVVVVRGLGGTVDFGRSVVDVVVVAR